MLEWFETFTVCAEVVGTIAFAASGAMIAIERELDLFGVLFLGITAAVGGGMLRDVMLGIAPPGAFRNPLYVGVAAATALAVFAFAWLNQRQYQRRYPLLDRVVNLLDAVGLGMFGAVGVQAAIAMGHGDSPFLCVFMGMITGVGGGILRDVFSRTVPAVLRKRIYAVASIAGCGLCYGLGRAALPTPAAMLAGMLVTVAIRMCAAHYRWDLPIVHIDGRPGEGQRP